MKKAFRTVAVLSLAAMLLLSTAGPSMGRDVPPDEGPWPWTGEQIRETHRHGSRAMRMVSQFTETTVLAKSPLLVMGIGGAYRYVTTPAERRAGLGLFEQPWMFGLCLAVSLLVLAKDTLLTTCGAFKKPLDVLAQAAHWAGAVLGIAFVAAGISDFTGDLPELADAARPQAFMSVGDDGTDRGQTIPARDDAVGGGDRGTVPVILDGLSAVANLFVYAVVFVVFNSVEAILVLNPFPFVDPALKGLRTAIIGFIYGLSRIHAGLGFLAALCVFVACLCVVHFCTRLAIISFVYSVGILRRLCGGGKQPTGDNVRAFSCWRFRGVPWLTYGRVGRTAAGNLEFTYKRLFLAWERTAPLPAGLAVGVGTFNPYLLAPGEPGKRHPLLRFSPIFKGQEASIGKALRVDRFEDISLPASVKRAAGFVWAAIRGRREAEPVK